MVLKLENISESPGGLTKTQIAGPHPRVSDPVGLRWAQEFAFLTSSLRWCWCYWSRGNTLRTTALGTRFLVWLRIYSPYQFLGEKSTAVASKPIFDYLFLELWPTGSPWCRVSYAPFRFAPMARAGIHCSRSRESSSLRQSQPCELAPKTQLLRTQPFLISLLAALRAPLMVFLTPLAALTLPSRWRGSLLLCPFPAHQHPSLPLPPRMAGAFQQIRLLMAASLGPICRLGPQWDSGYTWVCVYVWMYSIFLRIKCHSFPGRTYFCFYSGGE